MGRIYAEVGKSQIDKAEEYILNGIKILNDLKLKPLYSPGYLSLAELYADSGQKDQARENLKKANRLFREMGMNYWLYKAQKVLKRF